jgi:hypothetical protein
MVALGEDAFQTGRRWTKRAEARPGNYREWRKLPPGILPANAEKWGMRESSSPEGRPAIYSKTITPLREK